MHSTEAASVTAIRYLAIFLLPITIAVLLQYGTHSLRVAIHQENSELFTLLSSSSAEARTAILISMADDNEFALKDWLYWLFAGSIVLTGALSGFLIPVTSTDQRAVNMLTTMVCGFCTAKIVIGFWHMSWIEFGGWLGVGFVCAAIVIVSRGVLRKRALIA